MMRRGRRRFWKIALLLAAAAVLAVVVAMMLVSYSPDEKPDTVTQAEADEALRAVESVSRELGRVQNSAERGQRRPFEIAVSDKNATNFLRSNSHVNDLLAGKKIERPKVEFQNDRVQSSAYMTIHGRRLHITVTGDLVKSEAGHLAFRSTAVNIGKLRAPARIAREVDQSINAYLSMGKLPAEITGITMDDGQLRIMGMSDPTAAR